MMHINKEPPSLFLRTFGNSPMLRVLDFLIVHRRFDYCMKDIAQNAGVAYATAKLFWKDLLRYKIIVETRRVGNAKMFQLNTADQKVAQLLNLYYATIGEKTKKEILNAEIPIEK